jgi:hypothetical protein
MYNTNNNKFKMNKNLLLITFATLLTSVYASRITDGFITGIIINSFDDDPVPSLPRQSIDNNRYIYKTIDTELIPFTPKYQYKCYEIKIFIPLTTNEIFITSTFTGFFILIIISALSNMDEDGRDFMIGYMAARSMRKKRKW